MTSKRIATDGLVLSLALVLSYIDSLVPMPIPVAGIKLGLANMAVLFALYKRGPADAAIVSITRVILSGLMFAGMSGIMYSLSGALFSLLIMLLAKRFTDYHIVTVSVCGSLAHIMGQLLVAGLMVGMGVVTYYGPILLVAAFFTGAITGTITRLVINSINRVV